MSNNSSLITITAVLLLASGAGAGYTGYQTIKAHAQDSFLLKQSYIAQSNAMQTIYLAERAATDSAYISDLDNLDATVERALTSIRNGDPVRGIQGASPIVARNLEAFQKAWSEITPAISQIISQRGVTDDYSRNLADATKTARESLSNAKIAEARLSDSQANPNVKGQIAAAIRKLEEGVSALKGDSSVPIDTLRASGSAFAQYVSTLRSMGSVLPKEALLMTPLVKSFQDAESVQRLIQKAIDSSSGAVENMPHARTIWQSKDRIQSAAASLITSMEALPDSRPYGISLVAGLCVFSLLLSLAGMFVMRVITSSRTEWFESRGRNLEESTRNKSKELQTLLTEIAHIGEGHLNQEITEDNDSTKEIAKLLNKVFGKFAQILDEVKQTIVGLSAAAEQTMIMDQNVVKSRGEQEQAITHISDLFAIQQQFINQIETMTAGTEKTATEVLSRVQAGEAAVQLVHEHIIALMTLNQTIQHRSKHMIEIFQDLENISSVVASVADKSSLVAYNAHIRSVQMSDKPAASGWDGAGEQMEKLSAETRDAAAQIQRLLKMMNDAARETQSSVDHAQKETDSLRSRSVSAQEALVDIKQMTGNLNSDVSSVKTGSIKLRDQSEEVTEVMSSVLQYSADNSASSEQTAVAIGNVNKQAQELQNTIAHFRKA